MAAGGAGTEEEEDEEDGAAAALSSSPNEDSGGSFPLDLGHAEAAAQAGAERSSARASDDDDEGASARKKLRLSKEQSAFLEESFKEHSTLNPVSIHSSVHEKSKLLFLPPVFLTPTWSRP